MLWSQHYLSTTVSIQLHRLPPPPSTTPTATPKFSSHCTRLFSTLHQHTSPDHATRTHNANSTALLLRHLEQNPIAQNQNEDKLLLQVSLVSKRFPGSIYLNSSSSVEATNADVVDDEMLLKALEIRRKVTVEIFKEAMRKGGKFGITYADNLVSNLSDFIDYVIIKAAAMKKFPQFSQSSFDVRAQVFIDQSQVVPLIRWLKQNLLSYPQIGKLICASSGNLDSIMQLVEWLKSIHVKGRFIGVTLTRAGHTVFELSLKELDDIIQYLEDNGVRNDWIGYVVSRCPEILSFSIEEVRSRVGFYLSMGMSKNDFGTMVFDCPKVFGYLSMEQMNEKVAYLKEFGLSNEDVGRLLAFKPQLMACSIKDRWMPLVKYFYYLGISKDGMRRILTMKPMVFCVELEETIAPKVQFLRDIGIEEEAIGNTLVKFPSLLTYSLYKKIRPVVIFLLTNAGVSQRDIGKVLALAPELLGCSIWNKLDHSVKYFLSLGISVPQLGEMVSDFPMLLRYNIDVLRPKYRYLRRVMIRPLEDLIQFPRFFSYSLEGRIIPRHKVMMENRINLKLRDMLACTDEEFDMRVKDGVERRRRFEYGVMDEVPADHAKDDMNSQ